MLAVFFEIYCYGCIFVPLCHSEGISPSRFKHNATTRFLLNDKREATMERQWSDNGAILFFELGLKDLKGNKGCTTPSRPTSFISF
jgi:hypothetical protein